jgi:hypothetical protein
MIDFDKLCLIGISIYSPTVVKNRIVYSKNHSAFTSEVPELIPL